MSKSQILFMPFTFSLIIPVKGWSLTLLRYFKVFVLNFKCIFAYKNGCLWIMISLLKSKMVIMFMVKLASFAITAAIVVVIEV